MKIRNFLKKTLAIVLVFAMLAPIMGNLEVNLKEVKAGESTSEDSLNIKCQVTQGVVSNTSIDKYRNKYVIRFVSAVKDYTAYDEIGFKVLEEGLTNPKKAVVRTVFKRIESTTGSTADGTKETYTYSPKVVNTDAEYFMTAKLPVAEEDKAVKYTVWAYGKKDGKEVTGPERCVSVNDGLATCNTINMSFENTGNVNLTVDTTLKANDLGAEVIGLSQDNSLVHVRINKPTSLPSATLFELKTEAGEIVGKEIFRNLYTKYDGTKATVDKSWYQTNTSANEFVIATSADLYGFAAILNDNEFNFSSKTIYQVADIKVNDNILITEPTHSKYKQWYTAETAQYEDEPTYADWIPIARTGAFFNGEFDGQMHTISGLYCADNTAYTGLFGRAYTEARVKNLKLTNSYFASTSYHTGSIIGRSYAAELQCVYSDAIINTSDATYSWCGGLVGYANKQDSDTNSIIMERCWFDGRVSNSSTTKPSGGTGGMVGTVNDGTATLTNCLNTGYVSHGFAAYARTGGLVGDNGAGSTINLNQCLNAGCVDATYGASLVGVISAGSVTATNTYASQNKYVIGYMQNSGKFNVIWPDGQSDQTVSNGSVQNVNIITSWSSPTEFLGEKAQTAMRGVDFDTTWSIIPNENPVLTSFESVVMDTSWYDEDEDTYVLHDKADLWGFSALSQKTDFAGKTIKLGNDIVVNTGDTVSWTTSAPKYAWTPASSTDLPFAGTFDGGMHTISGLYMNTTSNNSGLFSTTSATSVIKNLKLKDCTFKSTAAYLGSVVGRLEGKLQNVYSNADVKSAYAGLGGLVGITAGNSCEIRQGWFAGTVTNTATGSESGDRRGTGGIVGLLYGTVTIENCLNTGTIDTTASSKSVPKTGGFVGSVEAGANLTATDCLNTGSVLVKDGTLGGYFVGCYAANMTWNTSYGYGNDRVVGYMNASGVKFTVNYIWGGSSGTSERDSGNYSSVPIMVASSSDILGSAATTKLAGFDFTNGTWLTVEGGTPVLNFSSDLENMDKRWYDASATEYVLYDKGDLYGFAELAKTTNFAGKTVKVGSDILVNEGNAANWSGVNHPNTAWEPIGYKSSDNYNAFTGTFDGQGHTISGLYFNRTNRYAGLFAAVGESGIIQNLRLENSYFESNNRDFGSITGRLDGKIYMVYSDAIIRAASVAVGGIAGITYGSEMENCWYNGDILKTADDTWRLGIGGIVGMATASTSESKVSLYNCLNTADFDISVYTSAHPCVGGLIGRVYENGEFCPQVSIDACLNTGIFTKNDSVVTGGVGPIVGYNSGAKDCVLINRTYATTDKLDNNITDEGWNVVNAGDIKGDDAKTNMPYLGGWDEDWRCVEGKFPEIIFSTEGFGTGVAASTDELTALTSLYANRSLYQGELHAHAKTYGKGQGLLQGDDGNVDLETWANSMEGLGLDFAASLDHNQTKHYELLDKSKFVYGTEAGTTITDATKTGNYKGELHYAMLFPDDSGLKNVLTQFNFDYSETTDLFSYKNFNRETFTNLIKTVQNDTNKGFFIHVHPTQTSYVSTDYLDEYHFVDYAGFEVFYLNTPTMDDMTEAEKQTYAQYGAYGSGETRTHYTLWTQLLNKGKRLYATSGSDTHRALNNYALTSVYSIADAATDKGKIITQLRDGDFTAGAVGIQMRIDDTKMGGHFNFKDTSRLVVNIDKFHFSDIVVSTHKYRVDVITDDGVVYRHPLTIDSSTSKPTNGKIALDVNPNSKYYRVEVVDATTGYRIAIGQPIWNDK